MAWFIYFVLAYISGYVATFYLLKKQLANSNGLLYVSDFDLAITGARLWPLFFLLLIPCWLLFYFSPHFRNWVKKNGKSYREEEEEKEAWEDYEFASEDEHFEEEEK